MYIQYRTAQKAGHFLSGTNNNLFWFLCIEEILLIKYLYTGQILQFLLLGNLNSNECLT